MNQAIGRFFRHGGNTTAANGGLNNNNSSKNVSKQIKFNESRLQPLSSLGHALDASRYGLTGGGGEGGDASVTRFGEILPLWKIFKSLGQFCIGLYNVWEYFEHALPNFSSFWSTYQF